MYKKLTLENLGQPFRLEYDGNTHEIPDGEFEAEMELGNFIFMKANELGFKVVKNGPGEEPKVSKIEKKKDEEEVEDTFEEKAKAIKGKKK